MSTRVATIKSTDTATTPPARGDLSAPNGHVSTTQMVEDMEDMFLRRLFRETLASANTYLASSGLHRAVASPASSTVILSSALDFDDRTPVECPRFIQIQWCSSSCELHSIHRVGALALQSWWEIYSEERTRLSSSSTTTITTLRPRPSPTVPEINPRHYHSTTGGHRHIRPFLNVFVGLHPTESFAANNFGTPLPMSVDLALVWIMFHQATGHGHLALQVSSEILFDIRRHHPLFGLEADRPRQQSCGELLLVLWTELLPSYPVRTTQQLLDYWNHAVSPRAANHHHEWEQASAVEFNSEVVQLLVQYTQQHAAEWPAWLQPYFKLAVQRLEDCRRRTEEEEMPRGRRAVPVHAADAGVVVETAPPSWVGPDRDPVRWMSSWRSLVLRVPGILRPASAKWTQEQRRRWILFVLVSVLTTVGWIWKEQRRRRQLSSASLASEGGDRLSPHPHHSCSRLPRHLWLKILLWPSSVWTMLVERVVSASSPPLLRRIGPDARVANPHDG